jgi:hypothetical protein
MDRINESFLKRPKMSVLSGAESLGESAFEIDESNDDVAQAEFELAQKRTQIEVLEKKLTGPTIDVTELVVDGEESLRTELQQTQATENASLRQELERLRKEESALVVRVETLKKAQGGSKEPGTLN